MASRSVPLALAAAALMAAPAGAQETFQGVITYQLNADGRAMTLRHMSRDARIRQEIEGLGMPGPVVVLVDLDANLAQMVMESMGMYMEIDLNQAAEMAGVSGPDATAPKVQKLGTSAVVAGIRCEDYRLGEDVEACIASGMGWFVMPRGQGRGARGIGGVDFSAFRDAFKDGMLPLRVKLVRNGNWEEIMVATAVERKPLEAGLFTLPPGLRKMNSPGGR